MKVYIGGGSGYIEIPDELIPSAGLQVVDYVSEEGKPGATDTTIAQSNPVTITDGQAVVVTASANLQNDGGAPQSTNYGIIIQTGPELAAAPGLSTPTIQAGDGFPLDASGTFLGLPAGTYVFALVYFNGGFGWTIGDYQITTLVGSTP